MIKHNNWFRPASFRLLALLAVILVALLGMMGPVAQTEAQEIKVPTSPPDAAAGLAIYDERCVVCHGELGDGRGAQALQAGLEPAAFADPGYRVTAVPSLMFDAISNGNLAAGMPPFGPASSNPLSDEEIWDLVALAYSFGTRPADIEAGEALAAELEADTTAWPGLDFWFGQSAEMILAGLESDNPLGVDLAELSEAERLSLVDFGRSLNYSYTDPLAAFAPVPLATINGQVINGTTNEAFAGGEVRLRAFTVQLEEMYSETAPINEDGSFVFEVENVPTDWVFLADVAYGDLTFNSNAVQVSNAEPIAQMPLFVFETTVDPAVVAIDRLHMIMTFAENRLLVSELYTFTNLETAVFVGESGDFAQGTIEVSLPTGSENVSFQRGFGTSLDSFIPATEFIQTETGWADTVPLRPGPNSLNLLVSYDLAYDDGLLLAHPLAYPVNSASAIMADAGVTITDGEWTSQGSQATAGGSFISYIHTGLEDADALSLTLDGRPSQISDASGNPLPVRNQTNELIVGGVGLAAVLAVGFYFFQRWRSEPVLAGESAMTSIQPVLPPQPSRNGSADALLERIADLDDAFAAGELEEADYQKQRQELKAQLTAVWE